jgi:2-pyrone-4,6-dicarboxylate lactonase
MPLPRALYINGVDRNIRRPDAAHVSGLRVTCSERQTVLGPPGFHNVVPFARRIVEQFPDRVLWGTYWSHPNLNGHMPNDGDLVGYIPRIAPTRELQHKLLIDNLLRLYWTH